MGRMSNLAMQDADDAYKALKGGVLNYSHRMTGAVVIGDKTGNPFHQSANYTGHHVELQLLAIVFYETKKNNTPYVLPNNCHVLIYVYHSPCESCLTAIRRSLAGNMSQWAAKSPTVQWKFVYSNPYVGPRTGGGPKTDQEKWSDAGEMQKAYDKLSQDTGGRVKIQPLNTADPKPGNSPRM